MCVAGAVGKDAFNAGVAGIETLREIEAPDQVDVRNIEPLVNDSNLDPGS